MTIFHKVFPSLRPKPKLLYQFPTTSHHTSGHTPYQHHSNNACKPIFDEAIRRDKVIKDIVNKLVYKVGDTTKPVNKKDVEEYGDVIVVEKICDTYGKYGRDEKWPEHDNPMIVHAYSKKKDIRFTCTTNYLQKV